MKKQKPRPSRATIYDVAKRASTSAATVSRVLAGRDSAASGTRERVLAAAADLSYQPNMLARNLSKQRSDMIATLLPDITNPFFAELAKALQSAALRHGYTLLICSTDGDPALERLHLDALVAHQVEYVFAVGLTLGRAAVERYVAAGISFIALDRPMRNVPSYLVQSDNRAGAALAVQHLLDLGHRQIAHIAGPAGLAQSRDRQRGYMGALTAAGLETGDELVAQSDFSEQGGAEAFGTLHRRGATFTAVFAADDLIAMGALSAAREHGRAVPRDLSVVGFDDILLARYTTPPLTTIRQDAEAMGAEAVRLIVPPENSRRQRKVILPVSLEVRGTTSPPRRAAPTSRR